MSQRSILNYFSRSPSTSTPNGNPSSSSPSSPAVTPRSTKPTSRFRNENQPVMKRGPEEDTQNPLTPKRLKTTEDSSSEQRSVVATPKFATPKSKDESGKKRSIEKKEYGVPLPSPKTPKILPFSSKSQSTPKGKGNDGVDLPNFTHLSLAWLKPDRVMDKKKRRPDHPDYDPKTLYVPKDFLDNSTTPALRQWWEMKSEHYDTILFFKMGKFYELWHMDAVIGVQELGIIFMKGDHAHCGFPEVAYSTNAEILVGKGYKVARIEQTETPLMMEERTKGKKVAKHEKVVRREICQVTTKGIRLATPLDERSIPFMQNSEYLYAITERSQANGVDYGVCFVDTTIGTFNIGQFVDDRHCSRLRTLFSHNPPVQILYEKGKLAANLNALMNNLCGIRKDALFPETEFWSAGKVLKFLAEAKYFRTSENEIDFPDALKNMISQSDSLGLTPAENWELGLKCFGAIVWYLHSCLVEHDLLTLRRFESYYPLDMKSGKQPAAIEAPASNFMVLDGSTLRNLEVTEGAKSLLSFVDNCATSFGKRLLRNWLCVPLANPAEIIKRQESIENLMSLQDLISKILPLLKSLLDLERLLGKIHTLGSVHRNQEHPDSRASFFEEKKYSKRKIMDLTAVLKCFKTCVNIINIMRNSAVEFNSTLLSSLITDFPSLDKLLSYFDEAFDHEAAIEAGKIQPVPGVVKEYDEAFEAVEDIKAEADKYLKTIKKKLGCKVVYFGNEKKRFQLEVPEDVKVPKDFDFVPGRKGFRRYTTKETKELLAQLIEAEANRENVVKDITRRIFAQFDESREIWNKAVKCISTLDTLMSLCKFSKSQDNMCRPTVVKSSVPFINIVDGRHPCVDQTKYIPNSCTLGSENGENTSQGTFLLLTGANMGGKSTTMKQTGLIAILAHMGCYVPATSCEMSVVDRVFTRIGASDNIAEGESTFFVELSETSAILKHASKDSLILMDELGRGTSTHDGNAFAYAVAQALSQRGARTIFSTHYHSLVAALKDKPSIQVGHMSCMVEREDENDDDPTQETITFLYKLTPGPCAKSYGFNAARLAGIPLDVIRLAHKKSKELESSLNKIALCRKLAAKIQSSSITKNDIKLISAC